MNFKIIDSKNSQIGRVADEEKNYLKWIYYTRMSNTIILISPISIKKGHKN